MKKIGFIGTGVMGKSMATHLMNAGNELYVYNRTKEKTDDLVANGATYCETPKAVCQRADVLFTMVGYPKDVEEVYFSPTGIFQADVAGKTMIDMTTSQPSLAKKLYDKAKSLGANALDAPVSGGDIGAKNARLTIMVGGDEEVFNEMLPLFEKMGTSVNYLGKSGSGQHTKMANQIGIAGTMTALTELLVYAKAANLDLEKVVATLSGGGANTWSLVNYSPRILKNDYTPGFFVKHFIKDLGIALEEAEKMKCSLPATTLAKELYVKLSEQGHENDGTQSLVKLWWNS